MPYNDPPKKTQTDMPVLPKPPQVQKPKGVKVKPQYSIAEWKLPEEVELTIEQLRPNR